MEIRKGPYGQFAIESTQQTVFDYAIEIINNGIIGNFLPVYLNYTTTRGTEIAYDFSGMTAIKNFDSRDYSGCMNDMRKSAADLFLSFLKCPDLLLPVTGIHISPEDIFYDNDNNRFYACLKPVLPESNDSAISVLINQDLESLLKNTCFAKLFTTDEIDEFCSLVNSNDEHGAESLLINIRNTTIDRHNEQQMLTWNQILTAGSLAGAAAIFLTIIPLVAAVVSMAGLIYLSVVLIWKYKNRKRLESDTRDTINRERKDILFSGSNQHTIESPGYLMLRSRGKIAGENIRRAIYTDRATIGSDCFLSDICIDDEEISAVHMSINLHDNKYFITDLSTNNESYIENIRMIPGKKYEIKNGQVLRCGNYEFDICIGYGN